MTAERGVPRIKIKIKIKIEIVGGIPTLLGVWTRNTVTTRVNIGVFSCRTRNIGRNNP